MFILGLELRVNVTRVRELSPVSLAIVTAGQWILLPSVILLAAMAMQVSPELLWISALLAVSPGGAISTFFVYLARGNTLLSLAMTIISSVLSPVALPVMIAVIFYVSGTEQVISTVSKGRMMAQLAVIILLPVGLGLVVCWLNQKAVEHWRHWFRPVSLSLLLALIAAAGWGVRSELMANIMSVGLVAAMFTTCALAVGVMLSQFVPPADRLAVMIECTVRNIPVALFLGAQFLPPDVVVTFLLCYFIIEALIIFLLIGFRQLKGV